MRREEDLPRNSRRVRPALVSAAAFALGGLCSTAIAQPPSLTDPADRECLVVTREKIVVELPPDQNSIERTLPMSWDTDFFQEGFGDFDNRPPCWAGIGVWSTDPRHNFTDLFPIELKTNGSGPFEVTIVLTEEHVEIDGLAALEDSEALVQAASHYNIPRDEFMEFFVPSTLATTLPAIAFDGQQPDTANYPVWRYRRNFNAAIENIELAASWVRGVWVATIDHRHQYLRPSRDVKLRITLRRSQACYMNATVTGGNGSGIYSGDVAVYGSPTGVSRETLQGFSHMNEWASSMAQSEAAQEQMAASGATAEQIQQIQELYAQMQMGGEFVQAELPGDVTLTLQDVKFDDAPPGTTLEALMRMAGHFVLSAQIDESAGFLDMLDATGPVTMGISQMGAGLPGLGLANTETSKGKCPGSSGNQITFEPCSGHEGIDFENGPFCGKIEGAVMCNEQMEQLTVNAEFLAGTELIECIR